MRAKKRLPPVLERVLLVAAVAGLLCAALILAYPALATPANDGAMAILAQDGGMDLVSYCDDEGGRLVLTERSARGWRCYTSVGEFLPIDYSWVCQAQYRVSRPYPFLTDVFNPHGWSCVDNVKSASFPVGPIVPPTWGGGLDLEGYCLYGDLQPLENRRARPVDGTTDWFCGDSAEPVVMQDVCEWQYGWWHEGDIVAISAPFEVVPHPYAWRCDFLDDD